MRKEIRAKWGIENSAFTFLFCAKFIRKKRPADLLQALALMQNNYMHGNSVHLLMVGDGELRTQCETFAREKGLAVTFAGFLNQSEIVRAYVAADCLVLPSDFGETWGLVVNEAMACALPAIVSDRVGCGPDLVKEGVTGEIFPFGSIEALAEKLISFAQNPNRARAMGRSARELIKDYSVERVVEGTISAVRYVCNGAATNNK